MFKKLLAISWVLYSTIMHIGIAYAEKVSTPTLSVTAGNKQIYIDWSVTNYSKIKQIEVFRAVGAIDSLGENPHDTIDISNGSGTYVDKGLVNGNSYVYTLRSLAKSPPDTKSDPSQSASAIPYSKDLLPGRMGEFQQYGFGVGFITTFYEVLGDAKIREAIVQNGKVRVKKKMVQETKMFLEAHAVWKIKDGKTKYIDKSCLTKRVT